MLIMLTERQTTRDKDITSNPLTWPQRHTTRHRLRDGTDSTNTMIQKERQRMHIKLTERQTARDKEITSSPLIWPQRETDNHTETKR